MKRAPANIFRSLQVLHKQDHPISVQIADQIRWLIVTNQLNPGDKLPPIRELADNLKVNFHTIRAAYQRLEENNLISTRRGLGSVVVEYKPSDTIPPNSMPTHTFGVIVPDLGNPFYPIFLKVAARIAQEHHVLLITCDTQERYSLGKAHFEMMITKRVDGMLIAPWGVDPIDENIFKADFYDYPFPIVFVDRPNIKGYSVLLDGENAGFQATQHLIDHGHTRIALITGKLTVPTLHQVYQGYLSALQKNSVALESQIVIEADEFSYAEGYRCMKKLIETKILPSAIFMAGDLYAVGAMKALREQDIRVPEDVAIVSYNNIDVADYVTPSLTSVSTPIQQLGEQSAEMLFKLVNHQPVRVRNIVLPSKLIIRESCGCVEKESIDKNHKEVYEENNQKK